ncbi:MAG: SufB/SufD family protein [Minisyncoccia bacterium]
MAMKNVKNVHYQQIDNKVLKIFSSKEVEVLKTYEAYDKYSWLQKYFPYKPKEGYFVWVKKQIDFPLMTCISLGSYKARQNLSNFLMIESGLDIKANVLCNALKENLCGVHQAKGKIILKKGAKLEYNHLHLWGNKDIVEPNYEFYLEEYSQLNYNYRNLKTPKSLAFKNIFNLAKNSQVKANVYILGENSKIKLKETLNLNGINSNGIIRLRLVGKNKSKIWGISKIIAKGESKGHLDCQGILVDNKSFISLIPNLVCKNKKAQLTHEASIGKISEEELMYLQSRGLTQKQAIDFIINGFIK